MSSTDSPNQPEQANAGLGYKEQLDEAAQRVKNPDNTSNTNEGAGLLAQAAEKGKTYIPFYVLCATGKTDGKSVHICSSSWKSPRAGAE